MTPYDTYVRSPTILYIPYINKKREVFDTVPSAELYLLCLWYHLCGIHLGTTLLRPRSICTVDELSLKCCQKWRVALTCSNRAYRYCRKLRLVHTALWLGIWRGSNQHACVLPPSCWRSTNSWKSPRGTHKRNRGQSILKQLISAMIRQRTCLAYYRLVQNSSEPWAVRLTHYLVDLLSVAAVVSASTNPANAKPCLWFAFEISLVCKVAAQFEESQFRFQVLTSLEKDPDSRDPTSNLVRILA